MKQIQMYYRIALLMLVLSLCVGVDVSLTAAQSPEGDGPFLRFLPPPSQGHPAQTGPSLLGRVEVINSEKTSSKGSDLEPMMAQSQVGPNATWDDRFGSPGLGFIPTDYHINTLALAGNGLYVGGEFSVIGSNIVHWDGRRWQALGQGVDDNVTDIISTPGDDIYVGGIFKTAGGINAGGIARWDGSNWSAVGSGVGVDGSSFPAVSALAWLNDTLYVAGRFQSIDGVPAANIARWDGNSWSALGTGVSHNQFTANINTLLVHNGLLYAGGFFDTAGGVTANHVAVWDGSNWSPLGSRDDQSVNALATDGVNIYAGGRDQTSNGQPLDSSITRWDGATWHSVGSGSGDGLQGGSVRDLVVIGSSLYAVGDFQQAGGLDVDGLVRWQNGTWSAVDGGIPAGAVNALAPSEDGGFYVGGDFTFAGSSSNQRLVRSIAKWRDGAWHALGAGPTRDNPLSIGWIPGSTGVMAADNNGNVYLSLFNTYVGGQLIDSGPVRWDGQAWSRLAAVEVSASPIAIDGDLVYFSGDFTDLPGVGAASLAIWNQKTQSWSALSSQLNGPIFALTVDQGILYAAGRFNVPGYTGIKNVAWWDGNQWSASAQMSNGQTFEIDNGILALAVVGGRLFVGGLFEHLIFPNGVVPVNNIVGLDLGSDQWFGLLSAGSAVPGVTFGGNGTSASVRTLTGVDGVLYVGGNFSQAGNLVTNDLAAWDANQGWSALGSGVGGEQFGSVQAMAVDGTDLYVGGRFTAAGPHQANHIARWDTVARAWSTLDKGFSYVGDDVRVTALAVGGSSLYVSGDFTEAGDQPAYGFARWGPPALVQKSGLLFADSGGSLTTSDGLKIVFPAGAVAEDVVITYQVMTAPSHALSVGQGAIRAFTLTAHTLDGVPITTFTQPYTLSLTYTEAELTAKAVQEANLNLLYWDNDWQAMLPCPGCSIDLGTNHLSVIANHFTEFAFVGEQQRVYLPLVIR